MVSAELFVVLSYFYEKMFDLTRIWKQTLITYFKSFETALWSLALYINARYT